MLIPLALGLAQSTPTIDVVLVHPEKGTALEVDEPGLSGFLGLRGLILDSWAHFGHSARAPNPRCEFCIFGLKNKIGEFSTNSAL